MKKILFSLTLILSIFSSAQAGYVIRGIQVNEEIDDLKNYTLTINNNVPVSAASMYHFLGNGFGRNSIVILYPNSTTPIFDLFPVPTADEDFNIEVRDFLYLSSINTYVLCGSRETATYSNAFVATIDGSLTTMRYNEFPEADIFYSVWADNSASLAIPDYYVCGKSGNHGFIASVSRINLDITHSYTTFDDQPWEYHKIILKPITSQSLLFVASGRNPNCTQVGFTTFGLNFSNINSYAWEQNSEPASLCVVCVYIGTTYSVILASSYQATVTLNPVVVAGTIFPAQISAYQFHFVSTEETKYNVQDIGMLEIPDAFNPRISVVGYIEDETIFRNIAWHGYVVGLSMASVMNNNIYFGSVNEKFIHYKVRGDMLGNELTGGYYQRDDRMCALFGTPLVYAPFCDHRYQSEPVYHQHYWFSFGLYPNPPSEHIYKPSGQKTTGTVYEYCLPFKGEELEPELVMPKEDESEIVTYYDRITVKDAPISTSYQIYSITGQLLQTGFATPDISTANLSKGFYLLRLENGKAFKFVK